jgi:hypothetical protein
MPPKITVVRLSVWDNYDRHCEELRAVGATDADLAPLRQAAEAVEAAEREEAKLNADLSLATAPFQTACGWIISPPTTAARFWAALCVARVTGGRVPEDGAVQLVALSCGLLALRLWGEGAKTDVMRLANTSDLLAERAAEAAAAQGAAYLDAVSRDWMILMGIAADGSKKNAAMERLEAIARMLRSKLDGAMGSSPSRSSPPGASGSVGPSIGTGSPLPS